MKKTIKTWFILICAIGIQAAIAQVPSNKFLEPTMYVNATVHVGNGKAISNANIAFKNGVIDFVGNGADAESLKGYKIIDLNGAHIYPGFIAAGSLLGLIEIKSVRATRDANEVGGYKPNVRSIIAYNTDSRVIPTVRSNGVLLAQITPQGGIIAGTSSVVGLDGWNWEDAAVKQDDGIWINFPRKKSWNGTNDDYDTELRALNDFFDQARAYSADAKPIFNARFEAMKPVFAAKCNVYINAYDALDLLAVIEFNKKQNCKVVIVGASGAVNCLQALKESNIPVILGNTHALPNNDDDNIDLPYKLPFILQEEEIVFGIAQLGESWQIRNLPFQCGTAVAYGLSKEQAVQAITGNMANILGLTHYGTLEKGKSATFFISSGDALDMKTNNVVAAFIDGKEVDLNNKQKELYNKFKTKYQSK